EEVPMSPDGKLLASAAGDVVCLWDVASGRLIHKLEEHAALGPYLRFSDDGRTLATGSRGNHVAVWDCATGKPVREMLAPPHGLAALLSFRDGRLLAYENANVEEEAEVPIAIW